MSSFKSFLKKTIEQNKQISNLILLVLDWLLIVFRVSKLDKPEADLSVLNTTKEKQLLTTGFFVFFIDYIYIYLSSLYLYVSNYRNTSLTDVKTQQLDNNNFYKFNNNVNIHSTQQLFLYGLKSI
jgi:hypothetical protein